MRTRTERLGGGDEIEGVPLVVEMHGVLEVAEGGSDALGALRAPVHEEADAKAAEHPEDADGVALAHPAAVFLRRHIRRVGRPSG